MDYKEQILAGILILIVFSYAMNHYKNQQMEEAYENMNKSEIEIKSSDYSDLNQEELKLLKEEMEEIERIEDEEEAKKDKIIETENDKTVANAMTTVQPMATKYDADLVIPRDPNNQTIINNLERRVKSLNQFEDVTTTSPQLTEPQPTEPQPTEPDTDSKPMSLGDDSTLIQQRDGQGMSSIFNPQIIINEGDSGSDINLNVKDNTLSIPLSNNNKVSSGSSNWSTPTHDLWSDSNNAEDDKKSVLNLFNSSYNSSYKKSSNRHNLVNSQNMGNTVDGYKTDGENVDTNYQNSPKTFYPGYSYMPPSNWSVPQRRAPICINNDPDTTKLPIGIADHGTPINALEVDPIGRILATEEKVKYTNVGSILPKFKYTEVKN